MRQDKIMNPLITVYNNAYYPRSYKNKNFIKEIKSCLPPITLNNECSSSKVLLRFPAAKEGGGEASLLYLVVTNQSVSKRSVQGLAPS